MRRVTPMINRLCGELARNSLHSVCERISLHLHA
jgi:hypothetical protein